MRPVFPRDACGCGRALTPAGQVDAPHDAAVYTQPRAASGDGCTGTIRKYAADTPLCRSRCRVWLWSWAEWPTPIAVFGFTRDMTRSHARARSLGVWSPLIVGHATNILY